MSIAAANKPSRSAPFDFFLNGQIQKKIIIFIEEFDVVRSLRTRETAHSQLSSNHTTRAHLEGLPTRRPALQGHHQHSRNRLSHQDCG